MDISTEESLLLVVLPPEMISEIFEKIPHQDWASLFIVSKEFEKISKSVFVTKLVTKMLSSEWIGKTQWLTFQGNPVEAEANYFGDRTGRPFATLLVSIFMLILLVSNFIFTKDGKVCFSIIHNYVLN